MKIMLWLLAMLLAACAPAPAARTSAAAPPTSASHAVAALATSDPGAVSRACKMDADCAVKDVGSCCGQYPACVNKDAQTFPEKVKAQCGIEHRMGVCSIPVISGCSCVQGKCADINVADAHKIP